MIFLFLPLLLPHLKLLWFNRYIREDEFTMLEHHLFRCNVFINQLLLTLLTLSVYAIVSMRSDVENDSIILIQNVRRRIIVLRERNNKNNLAAQL